MGVQSLELSSPRVSKVPPPTMLGEYLIEKDDAKMGLGGLDANDFLEQTTNARPGSCKEFVKRHMRFRLYPANEVSLTFNDQYHSIVLVHLIRL